MGVLYVVPRFTGLSIPFRRTSVLGVELQAIYESLRLSSQQLLSPLVVESVNKEAIKMIKSSYHIHLEFNEIVLAIRSFS